MVAPPPGSEPPVWWICVLLTHLFFCKFAISCVLIIRNLAVLPGNEVTGVGYESCYYFHFNDLG